MKLINLLIHGCIVVAFFVVLFGYSDGKVTMIEGVVAMFAGFSVMKLTEIAEALGGDQ